MKNNILKTLVLISLNYAAPAMAASAELRGFNPTFMLETVCSTYEMRIEDYKTLAKIEETVSSPERKERFRKMKEDARPGIVRSGMVEAGRGSFRVSGPARIKIKGEKTEVSGDVIWSTEIRGPGFETGEGMIEVPEGATIGVAFRASVAALCPLLKGLPEDAAVEQLLEEMME